MNERPHDNDFEEFLAGQSDLTESYRKLGSVEPPADLDARILAEARRAASPRRRFRPWRRKPVYALAAVLVLGLSAVVSWNALQPNSPQLMSAPSSLSMPGKVSARRPASQPASGRMTNPAAVTEDEERPVRTGDTVGTSDTRAAKETHDGPGTLESVGKSRDLADTASAGAYGTLPSAEQSRSNAGIAAVPKAEGSRDAALADEDKAAQLPRPPDPWLEEIEEMLERGATEDARKEVLRFRESYPDYELPKELSGLLPADQR